MPVEYLPSAFARVALDNVARAYPRRLDQLLHAPGAEWRPGVLHPAFYGSYDWHSAVHMHWSLARILRVHPDIPERPAIEARLERHLTPSNIARELGFFNGPGGLTFERPYGWAWLLYLHLEATRHQEGWGANLEPLARAFADRLGDYLKILTYPIRVGTHFNTAFALILSLEWADRFDPELASQIRDRSRHWYGTDRDCQAWEPGGDEFLSPALIEALCMARSHPALFPIWFEQFLPRVRDREPATLFTPAIVSDRSDGKIAHLDGLNLSRAWCWRRLAPLLPEPERSISDAAADEHLAAAMPHLSGDYMGEHWLQSFALLALLSGTD